MLLKLFIDGEKKSDQPKKTIADIDLHVFYVYTVYQKALFQISDQFNFKIEIAIGIRIDASNTHAYYSFESILQLYQKYFK